MKELVGSVSINRTISNAEEDSISIRIEDRVSRTPFVRAKMSMSDFAQAITGLSMVDATLEVLGLSNVGKSRETEHLEFEIPSGLGYGKERCMGACKASKEACPDGWTPSTYFGSQNSFFTKDGKDWARCSITRYVEGEAE